MWMYMMFFTFNHALSLIIYLVVNTHITKSNAHVWRMFKNMIVKREIKKLCNRLFYVIQMLIEDSIFNGFLPALQSS